MTSKARAARPDVRPEFETLEPRLLLAGVTLITHGHSAFDTTWVARMSDAVEASLPGSSATVYRITVQDPGSNFTRDPLVISATKLHDGAAADGEIILQLDWSDVAGINPVEMRWTSEVAALVVPKLLDPTFLPGLGTAAAELPMQLIGHSRGASLVSEIARGLGEQGVWVDQMTLLDPNPPFGADPASAAWSNVVFADDYYEQSAVSSSWGGPRTGAFNELIGIGPAGTLPGGNVNDHMDVPAWYDGSIDSASDLAWVGFNIDDALRDGWYIPAEEAGALAGWFHSRLGGGDRSGTWSPGGASGELRDGLGADFGGTGARLSLDLSAATWCNVGELALARSQFLAGESASVSYMYQDVDSAATVSFYLDTDRNPYDGGLTLVGSTARAATGASPASDRQPLTFSVAPGTYFLVAKIADATHVRYAYIQAPIGIVAANHAPVLDNTGEMLLRAVGISETAGLGTPVSALLASAGGNRVTDSDPAALEGIAVVAADGSHGTWQFSTDSGMTWSLFGAPSGASARLLASDGTTRIRFLPTSGFSGNVLGGITFRAWDQASGANGGTADVSINGGATAFSAATESADILVVAPDYLEPSVGALDMSWFAAGVTPALASFPPAPALSIDTAGNADWFTFTVPFGATGTGHLGLSGMDGLLLGHIALYNHPLGSLGFAPWGPMSDATAASPDHDVSLAMAGLTPGATYWVKVNGWFGTLGIYTLDVTLNVMPPDALEPNDTSGTATNITPGLVAGNGLWTASGLSINLGSDVDWFRLDAPSNAEGDLTVQVSHLTGGLNAWALIYRQFPGGVLLPVAAAFAGSWPNAIATATVFSAQPNTSYWIRVSNNFNETGGYDISVQFDLLHQPQDRFDLVAPFNDRSWLPAPAPLDATGHAALTALTIDDRSDVDWFWFTVPATSTGAVQVTLSNITGGLVAQVAVYDTAAGSLSDMFGGIYTTLFGPSSIATASNANDPLTLNVTPALSPGRTYFLKVSGVNASTGGYDLGITAVIPALAISPLVSL